MGKAELVSVTCSRRRRRRRRSERTATFFLSPVFDLRFDKFPTFGTMPNQDKFPNGNEITILGDVMIIRLVTVRGKNGAVHSPKLTCLQVPTPNPKGHSVPSGAVSVSNPLRTHAYLLVRCYGHVLVVCIMGGLL